MIPALVRLEKEDDRREVDKYKFMYLQAWTRNTILIQASVGLFSLIGPHLALKQIIGILSFQWMIASGILWLYADDSITRAYKGKLQLSPALRASRRHVLQYIAYTWVWSIIFYLAPDNRGLFFSKDLRVMSSELTSANEILNNLKVLPQTVEVKTAISQAKETIMDLEAVDQQKKEDEAGIIAYNSFKELQQLHERALVAQTIQKELMAAYHTPQLEELKALAPQVVKSEVVGACKINRPDPTRIIGKYYEEKDQMDLQEYGR